MPLWMRFCATLVQNPYNIWQILNEKPPMCSIHLYLHGKLTTKPLCTCIDDVSTSSAEGFVQILLKPTWNSFWDKFGPKKKTALERRWSPKNGAGTALQAPKMALERCWNGAGRGKLGILNFCSVSARLWRNVSSNEDKIQHGWRSSPLWFVFDQDQTVLGVLVASFVETFSFWKKLSQSHPKRGVETYLVHFLRFASRDLQDLVWTTATALSNGLHVMIFHWVWIRVGQFSPERILKWWGVERLCVGHLEPNAHCARRCLGRPDWSCAVSCPKQALWGANVLLTASWAVLDCKCRDKQATAPGAVVDFVRILPFVLV